MAVNVAVLVSTGRHPASGRPRRAPADARAVELALRLAGPAARVVHAGDPACPALRDYLGMGLERMTVLDLPVEADPVPALVGHLKAAGSDLVLAGVRAENGEDSGGVPYAVAEALGYAIVPGVADIILVGEGVARVLQALPRGQRRAITAPLPLVATIDTVAPAPRSFAFARARRGTITTIAAEIVVDDARAEWETRPACRRPPRLPPAVVGAGAADRLRSLTDVRTGRGRLIVDPSPEVAAREIYEYLVAEGVLDPSAPRHPLPTGDPK